MKTVILLSADTGGGHEAAAQAIASELRAQNWPDQQIVVVNTFCESGRWPFYRLGDVHRWAVSTRPGRLLHTLMFWWDQEPRSRGLADAFCYWGLKPLFERLRSQHPEAIWVSLHPFITQALGRWKERAPFPVQMVTMVTELAFAPWACLHPAADLCLVDNAEVAQQALRVGVRPERLRVTGLPLKPGFSQAAPSAHQCRQQLGLSPELPTLLLISGGEGFGGSILDMCRALDCKLGARAQLLVVTGHNQELLAQLQAQRWSGPVRCNGFVNNMETWLGASDLVLTKSGPGTLCEILAVGRPMVLFAHLPGPERRNIAYLEQQGAAVFRPRQADLIEEVWQLLHDRQRLQSMAQRAQSLSRPGSAGRVVAGLNELTV